MNPEKKKIIYVSVRSDFGGGTYHIDLLINNLKDEFDIYIAAPLNEPYGVEWQKLIGKEKFLVIPFRSFKINYLFKLINFIKKNNIGIIHAHGKGGSIYGRLSKIFLPGIKVLYTPHGFHVLHYNKVIKKLYIFIERFLSRFTDLIINVSGGEQKEFLDNKIIKKTNSVVVYNAINIEKINTDKKILREKLNLPQGKFIVVLVVRFNYQKNLKATINIAEILSANDDILFLIIGEGEERKDIEDLIIQKNLSNVLLAGYKNNVNEYLSACDIYLSTSLWEGLPYSLIEAAANGLPIVASDVTGNNEIVEQGVNGYLFNLNNLNDAADFILKLKNSDTERRTLRDNSIRIFKEKFQLEEMIKKTRMIYNNLFTEK